jgi:phenylalanyl-tRNA synthetase beta chain
MFSHIGTIRELATLYNFENPTSYKKTDLTVLPEEKIENKIPEVVNRYSALRIENVKNIETPEYIKKVLDANEVTSKGLLVDMTNYSLYFYGQPTHAFDADKISGNIVVRYATE